MPMKRLSFIPVLLAGSLAAWAGPPFVTDDPVPVETGHWEVYGFSSAIQTQDQIGETLAGFDINYGVVKNLHLHVLLPLAFNVPTDGTSQLGPGDVEFGAKYRIFDPGDDAWWPQVAVYPAITVPTGDDQRGLGAGSVRAFLPVWLEKDFGKWSTYGGAGYEINPGVDNLNYGFFGWVLQRQVTEQLALGGEITHTTADVIGGPDVTGFNLGATYDITRRYHVLVSGGRGVQNAEATDQFQYYVGVQWTN